MKTGKQMTTEELVELYKKIFCPFIAVAGPTFYLLSAYIIVSNWQKGIPLEPVTWGQIAVLAFFFFVSIWCIYICYSELGGFNKKKESLSFRCRDKPIQLEIWGQK